MSRIPDLASIAELATEHSQFPIASLRDPKHGRQ
jgi:hypothetical protein